MYNKISLHDASQCSHAVCGALYEDLVPFLQKNFQQLPIEQLMVIENLASCYGIHSENVDCGVSKNEVYQIFDDLRFLTNETPKLAPYFILCF